MFNRLEGQAAQVRLSWKDRNLIGALSAETLNHHYKEEQPECQVFQCRVYPASLRCRRRGQHEEPQD
ncbi:hypothetical protein M3J07_011101 [Ascochyta lentis]